MKEWAVLRAGSTRAAEATIPPLVLIAAKLLIAATSTQAIAAAGDRGHFETLRRFR